MATRLPRAFTLPWGKGLITEEVRVEHDHWAPVIQLLEYEDGSRGIRFCTYTGPRFQRTPPIWMEEDVAAFKEHLKKTPKLRKMLMQLVS